jgi:hypothetical protein
VGGSRPGSDEGWLGFVEESVGPVFVELVVCFGVVFTVVCGVELIGVVVCVGVAVEVGAGVEVATTGVEPVVPVRWCLARRRAAARRRRTAAA